MGGSTSKISRKLPSKPSASWTGVKTDRSVPHQLPRNAVASETKNALIEMDAGDPHFMEKLKQLGPVKVDHHMSPVPAYTHMRHVIQTQEASEQEAASRTPPRNRLRASELFSALERRRSVRSPDQLQRMASEYNIDLDVLERIARYTNTPSIIEESRRKTVDEDGKERFTVVATWKDPALNANSVTKAT